MNRRTFTLLCVAIAAGALPAAAHHSFAIYDMQQDVEFHGVIDTIKFRNPHMAMTLKILTPAARNRPSISSKARQPTCSRA